MSNISDVNQTDTLNLGVSSLLNLVVLQYFAHIYSNCIIRSITERPLFDGFTSLYPFIWTDIEESTDDFILTNIENGCQSFILTEKSAIYFLDRFQLLHDRANQRFANKYVIVLLNQRTEKSLLDRITQHHAVLDIPRLLIIFSQSHDRIDLMTTSYNTRGYNRTVLILDSFIPSQKRFREGNDLFPDKIRNLSGMLVRLAIFNYSPYTLWNMIQRNQTFNALHDSKPVLYIDGTESKVFLEFCAKFNCSLDISLDEAGEWGEIFDNRTGNGIIGAVVERRADIGAGALYSWYHENQFLTLSKPISRTGVTCITPKPKLLSSWMTPILPFSSNLWIAVLTTIAVVSVVSGLTEYVVQNILLQIKRPVDICNSFMIIGSIFILQTVLLRINRSQFVSQIILMGSLLFVGLIIGNTYSGGLSSIMTIPRFEPPINTVQDLTDSNIHWAATQDAWIFSIRMATQPTIVKLLQNFETHPKEFLHTRALKGELAYSIERLPYGHFSIGEYIDEELSSKYQNMIEDIYWEYCVAMSTKTWPMVQHLDELILVIFQSGIQRYWEQKVVSIYENYNIQLSIGTSRHRESAGPVKLQPSHLLGAFLMLAIGLTGSLVAFVLELIYGNCLFKCLTHPKSGSKDDDKDTFHAQLERAYDSCPKHDVKIVIVDLNAQVCREEEFRPVIRNIPNPYRYTWRSPQQTESQIIHVLIDGRHFSDIINVRTYRGANVDSDHYLLMVKMRQRLWIVNNNRYRRPPRYDLERLKFPEVVIEYVQSLEAALPELIEAPLEDCWSNVKAAINSAAEGADVSLVYS
ncbi:uncharacterized protein LOC129729082 [Wyeomyia smithii]|uniref:uncharacterized protein LOC129729082 n=1 Tax=Wyeomyia smithii TaxID=174621 RepID=UPI002467F2DB|nr:uncharacterized protein LOC129729082 [Wyeomyia smithii]